MKINRGVVALIITVVIWGTSFIAIKIALNGMGPFCLSAFRFAVAFIFLYPFAYRQGYRFTHSFQTQYLVLGLTGIALFYSLQNFGLMFTTAGGTALILGGAPAVITIFAMIFLKERPLPEQLAGIGLAVIGIILVSLTGIKQGYGSSPAWGVLLLLIAIVTWSIYTIQGKRVIDGHSALLMTTASIGGGLLILFPLAFGEIYFLGLPKPNIDTFIAVLYLGIVGSAITMFLYNYALKYMNASMAAPYINLTPIVGVICAQMFGERIGIMQVMGGIVVLCGVWLSNSRRIVVE